jgi:DNA mismatch repair ATPase MutS
MNSSERRDPETFYHGTIDNLTNEISSKKQYLLRISWARLAIFVVTLVLFYLASNWGWISMTFIAIGGISIFLVLLVTYQNNSNQLKHLKNLEKINRQEHEALKGNYSSFDPGKDYIDPEHAYSNDLDLFGTGSVFQFLNRTTTFPGKDQLAKSLTNLLQDKNAIQKRQRAIGELSEKVMLRQEFRATGFETEETEEDHKEILKWAKEEPELNKPIVTFWLLFMPTLATTVIVLSSLSIIPSIFLLFYLMIVATVYNRYQKIITRKHRLLGKRSGIISKYGMLIRLIEEASFNTPELIDIKKSLSSEGKAPSQRLKKLYRILNAFDQRLNLLMGFVLNVLFLWDILQSKRMEKWLADNNTLLPVWLDTVATIDCLNSFSNFYFNNPGVIFPEINESVFGVEGREIGHPLIPSSQLVKNPISITGNKQFYVVTGANMAGKSTYLRTVGINLILAMAGAPVMAKSFKFMPVALISSIRASDSLTKNESYFYAELKHLKRIVDCLEAGDQLFILLDEILKGTNSRDKQSGSIAFIKKLLRYDASGLIATHDLALGELEKDFPDNIINKSFEVVIKDDQLVFDYLLKDGIARQMNATFLMEKMGITS